MRNVPWYSPFFDTVVSRGRRARLGGTVVAATALVLCVSGCAVSSPTPAPQHGRVSAYLCVSKTEVVLGDKATLTLIVVNDSASDLHLRPTCALGNLHIGRIFDRLPAPGEWVTVGRLAILCTLRAPDIITVRAGQTVVFREDLSDTDLPRPGLYECTTWFHDVDGRVNEPELSVLIRVVERR
jgi:hypothetical protein